jgi:hypothetical protein
MPTDDGIGLHDGQRLDGIWHQTIQPNKNQAIHGTEGHSLRHMPSMDVESMTRIKSSASNETRDRNNKTSIGPTRSFSHEIEALRDSASRTNRIRFSTGSGRASRSPTHLGETSAPHRADEEPGDEQPCDRAGSSQQMRFVVQPPRRIGLAFRGLPAKRGAEKVAVAAA